MKREFILFISDLQIPYHHPDSFDFLKAIKKKFNPTSVYNVGDLVDSHTLSFHEIDVDLLSASDEIEVSRAYINQLGKIFPTMKIALGNHDIRLFRKAKAAGIPRDCIRSIHEVFGCPKGWEWGEQFSIKLEDKSTVLMIHNCGNKDPIRGVHSYGASIIQGHYHTEASVQYASTHDKLMFGMVVGCLIDTKALAFEYNKLQLRRPILSVGVIDQGVPRIIPMLLDRDGKWTGKL